MSAPARDLHERLFDQHLHRLVVDDAAVLQEAVVAVIGERIERDVDHDADIRRGVFHRAHGGADEAVCVERFAAACVLLGGVDVREDGDRGNAELLRRASPLRRRRAPRARDARHRGDRDFVFGAVMHDHRPDQIVRRSSDARASGGAPNRLWRKAARAARRDSVRCSSCEVVRNIRFGDARSRLSYLDHALGYLGYGSAYTGLRQLHQPRRQ